MYVSAFPSAPKQEVIGGEHCILKGWAPLEATHRQGFNICSLKLNSSARTQTQISHQDGQNIFLSPISFFLDTNLGFVTKEKWIIIFLSCNYEQFSAVNDLIIIRCLLSEGRHFKSRCASLPGYRRNIKSILN